MMCPDNRVREAFDCIKAGEELKAATKEFLRTSRPGGRRTSVFSSYRVFRHIVWRTAACAILFVVLGAGGYTLLWTPFSYVSIDVNPSLELALNRFDRVISAEAYNEDGEEIMEGISVGGMYYTDAIDIIMESNAMQPYLAGDASLVFTVAAGSGRKEEGLLSGIEQTSGCADHGGRGARTDMDVVEEAHANGFSLGKYAAYKILQQYDDSFTAEDCHDMSMSEIDDLIEQHEHGEHSGCGSDGYEGSCASGEDPDGGAYNNSASEEDPDGGAYNNSASGEDPDGGAYNNSASGEDPDSGAYNGSGENADSGKDSDRGTEEGGGADESQNSGSTGGNAGGTNHHAESGNGHGSGHGAGHD